MVIKQQKYNVIDMKTGHLDRSIFTDPAIYQEELEKIFARSWLMIGHVSLVPNPNDFFLTYMGEDPVIMTRDTKGKIHAFLNMCMHRGNRIVRADKGNAKSFMCAYHGWTFSNEGKLVSVPGFQEAYYGELPIDKLGLVEVAQLDIYAGIVWATWDPEAPSLEAFLGDARYYTDTNFNRRDVGQIAMGPHKWMEPLNWKTPVDNSSDNYHVPVTHHASNLVQGRYGMNKNRSSADLYKMFFASKNRQLFVNGHSLTLTILDETNTIDQDGRRAGNPALHEEAVRRLGEYRATKIRLRNHSLFPHGVLGFRLAHPRGPMMTEFWSFAMVDGDATEEQRRAASRGMARGVGAAGLNEQDDIDNWRQVSMSGQSFVARRYPQNLSLGVGHSIRDPQYPGGLVAQNFLAEENQRGYYLRWQEFMNANSWADIHIDPITAKFEGTAQLHG